MLFPSKRYRAVDHVGKRRFLYVELSEDFQTAPTSMILEWAMNRCGFGMFTFCQNDDGSIYVDTECMLQSTVEKAVFHFCENTSPLKWPPLLRAFATPRNFLNHCVFTE